MEALRERGLDKAVHALVAAKKPFLGICVGMQVLFESSDEFGGYEGLGVFRGEVRRFTDAPRVPHMGWNDLRIDGTHPFVAGLNGGEYAYFLHSYRVADSDATMASADYGGRFAAVVARGNVMATQFHPEKSQRTGAVLLDNFLALAA
jgi:glutamine amidotransferase